MSVRCKVCCVGAGVALLGLAATGSWALLRNKETPPAPQPATGVKHASAPQVLTAALERLHREALAHFHADPKNGLMRMPPVYEKVVKDWTTPWISSGELDRDEPIPFADDMKRLHAASLKDFLTPQQIPVEPAGQPFAIIWEPGKYDRDKKVWEAKSIDLVGLLKNPDPVVYVSEKIAAMRPDEPPMRALDEFELGGLQALRKGEQLFGRSREGVIRLLGAVRADASCVACHRDKQEGDLLGAFSYVLREAQYQRRLQSYGPLPGTKK